MEPPNTKLIQNIKCATCNNKSDNHSRCIMGTTLKVNILQRTRGYIKIDGIQMYMWSTSNLKPFIIEEHKKITTCSLLNDCYISLNSQW